MGRALILDCGQALRSMVAYVLDLEGFEVSEAADLTQLRGVLDQGFAPDIIIACSQATNDAIPMASVKAHSALKDVPVLLIAAEDELDKQMEWKEAGITCWVTQPFTPGELLEMVRMMMFRPEAE